MAAEFRSNRQVVRDYWEWYERACEKGWTEGLPVCPPTLDRVEEALAFLKRAPDDVVGIIPPKNGLATMEQVVINCLMAGCSPQMIPALLAALDAVLDPAFELAAVQITTNACAPLIIVGGPISRTLAFNGRHGSFAGGSRANTAVGRALRLILRNIGGAVPGVISNVSQGHPGWYSFCVVENEDESPWGPLHVDRGFGTEASCVTVFCCQPPFPLYVPGTAERILRVIAASLPTPGVNMFFGAGQLLLAFSPKPALELARAGYTKADVRRWIWEHARFELGQLRRAGVFGDEPHTVYWGARRSAPNVSQMSDDTLLPMVDSPDDILVIVTGASGQWWVSFCPGWGEFGGLAVTRPVYWPGS